MRTTHVLLISTVFLLFGLVIFADLPSAQAQDETAKMPDVIMMGKEAKLGPVKFEHVKHNSGAYTIDQTATIACIECHHTARPAAEIAKNPPLKTAWPADRTTTLTADLFTKDPKEAGVAKCGDCHSRAGAKPKMLDAIPEVKHEGSTALISLNNQNAIHRACVGCHAEVRKKVPASKAPIQAQCTVCHKKA